MFCTTSFVFVILQVLLTVYVLAINPDVYRTCVYVQLLPHERVRNANCGPLLGIFTTGRVPNQTVEC